MQKTINIITLGCSKNLVDSERLARQLAALNYRVVFDSNRFTPIVIINTCGFIHDAKEESVQTILNAIQAKEQGKIKQVFVIGCLSERYANELRSEIPEVDAYFGARNFADVLQALQSEQADGLLQERILSTPKHISYLKLAEGCNRKCAFCAIPAIRGAHVSTPIKTLVQEAQFLAKHGVKELSLISQDLSYYGVDLYKKNALAELLPQLEAIDGLEWIRLHYLYPNNFPVEILPLMQQSQKICHYIDIPFQHSSSVVLNAMRRGSSEEETWKLIETMRTAVPDIAIRTSLIVGYPSETEQEFEKLLQFVRHAQFDRVGVFTYSHEEGTYAAEQYKDAIPQHEKEARRDAVMTLQNEISLQKNKQHIGKIMKVLVDRKEGNSYVGRTQYDAYEVDNEVIINSAKRLFVGKFYSVRIDNADAYELIGEI
ncbi:MAG: 30S ribosomal protein S12 methylthiotransferase RimO [Bacteroidales bacterium]|jgi:ribosomal protein S12 methylthiotransferase|nr:30S ribosomal protein S12 methylthiotransferase RimO [Bacteroidales bacterium]